jgi:lysyl-tRNA synthetase class II
MSASEGGEHADEARPQTISIAVAQSHAGERVTLQGWLYNLRKSGKIVFPVVRDGTGLMQCVAVKSNLPETVFDALKNLTQESSLTVTGTVRAEARAHGGFELDVDGAHIIQRVPEEHPYPITPKDHGVDFLMDHRHLWLRSRRQHAAIRVRHEIVKGIRDYFGGHADLHAGRLRRHEHSFRSRLLRGRKGLPYAIRAALQRSERRRLWQSVLLRPHISRRKIEDSPAPY